jgi:DNA invertase Pin-like site-specific DNA recombinase
MPTTSLIPAAQYLRMSTDDQPNSIPFQKEAIRRYAAEHGYEVVKTYADLGKSGVGIKHRPGLRQLIQAVVEGHAPFRVILVYDISRWGRFQDSDESAHFEFLCKSAGVPIHYCAEQFVNDDQVQNQIMKALKRTMAGEFSRELAAKVRDGMRNLAAQGFRGGGPAGYGLRRMTISIDGRRNQLLQTHEQKAIRSHHVILVPGPKREVEAIRLIFALAAKARMRPGQIASELNRRNIQYVSGRSWTSLNVLLTLKNEKYIGCNVWGKTNKPFGKRTFKLPRSTWVTKPNAFVPLVSVKQFARVQKLIRSRNNKIRKPDSYYISEMRKTLKREGKLSHRLLRRTGFFDHRAFARRFGSLMRAYEQVGYTPSARTMKCYEGFCRSQCLRAQLLTQLGELFPSQLRVVHRTGQSFRQAVELDNGVQVAVHICRPLPRSVYGPRWLLVGNRKERGLISLICFTNKGATRFEALYVVPEVGSLMKRYKVLWEGHPLLEAGKRLESLAQFHEAAKGLLDEWKTESDITIVGDALFKKRASSLTIAGKELRLSRIESQFVNLLFENPGRLVSLEQFRRLATNPSDYFVRGHISALRAKLGRKFGNRLVTVVNKGYMYKPDVPFT